MALKSSDEERDTELVAAYQQVDENGEWQFSLLDLQMTFEMSHTRVYQILDAHGVPRRKKSLSNKERAKWEAEIVDAYQLKDEHGAWEFTVAMIKLKFGVSSGQLYIILDRRNIPRRGKSKNE